MDRDPGLSVRLKLAISYAGFVMAAGVLLLVAPWMGSDAARHWIIVTFAVVFGSAALGNAWALRGRHFGWIAMSAVVALAVAGY